MKKITIMICALLFTIISFKDISVSNASIYYQNNMDTYKIDINENRNTLEDINGDISISVFLNYVYNGTIDRKKDKMQEYSDFHFNSNKSYLSKLKLDDYSVFVSEYAPVIVIYANSNEIDLLKLVKKINSKKFVNTVTISELNQTQKVGFPGDLCYYGPSGELICDPPPPPPPPPPTVDLRDIDYDKFPSSTIYTGDSVKIGILDKGFFDTSHNIFEGRDVHVLLDDENGANNSDWHPTMVGGIIGGNYGIANKASLYFADVQHHYQYYKELEVFLNLEVDVINISLSVGCNTNNYESVYAKYVNYLVSKTDVIIVAASGNNLNKQFYDGRVCQVASYANVISVGSIDIGGYPSQFSNFEQYNYEGIDEVSNPLTIVAMGDKRSIQGLNIAPSGTSFSAPVVTGTVALLLEKHNSLTAFNVMTILSVTSSSFEAKYHTIQLVRLVDEDGDELVPPQTINKYNSENLENGLYSRYGAGSLDITAALNYEGPITQNDLPPLYSGDTHFVDNLYVQSTEELVVALAWERVAHKNTENVYNQDELIDLAVRILDFDGNVVSETTSVDSNLEMIRFTPTTNGYYTIEIIANEDAISISKYSISYIVK